MLKVLKSHNLSIFNHFNIIQFPSPLFLTHMAPSMCSKGLHPHPVHVASPTWTEGQKKISA
jgi:hypothetical protein